MTQGAIKWQVDADFGAILLLPVFRAPNMRDLLHLIGSEVESQTRTRVKEEKETPDGKSWDDWSEAYAASQHGDTKAHGPHPGRLRSAGGHSILELGGSLWDSLQFETKTKEVLVGSNLKYARRMNAQRQYLGLSLQDRKDIENLTLLFLEGGV